ncbi:Stp1/IreP family PP2C-type Ser/Thr phosphatase [Parafannyhessea umbonata]|uniref:Protein phosphatase n=1 Tax=Parafannyhessea umbonata TaxID=604330 RepID=A0A1H1NNF6_9ACTN|nr:Stp1/IreP family PP2C-type Ser/Thr phosphatase [Parafannyhessea umbonata]SDS00423.1 protein phosphatase [Parafannyhessea umbonata]
MKLKPLPLPRHRESLYTRIAGHGAKKPVASPGHDVIPVENREGTDSRRGASGMLAWGARTDIGLVRSHNEDSFLVQAPVFAVCDGMGGHAAGEVASSIAVETIAANAPLHADDVLLGAAVEAANAKVIEGAKTGKGKPGMGCTASCILVEKNKVAIAHVGDSRIYLLHAGALVRLTHDHSYVEELVDAGEITADEARVHPSRSIITRALGNDPDMYADHFTLEVTTGDRIIICSDGLSSMVEDSEIEDIAVSCVDPQTAADNLVSAALAGGGHDNVTVVVVDVLDDGSSEARRTYRRRWLFGGLLAIVVLLALVTGSMALYVRSSWYLGNNNGTVGIYSGVNQSVFGVHLGHLVDTSSVQVSDLPAAIQQSLKKGVAVDSEQAALDTVESYRDQIDTDKTDAAITADKAKAKSDSDQGASDSSQSAGATASGGE